MKSSPLSQFEIDINKFETIKKISKGSFGEVFLVIEKDTKKKYAAKLFDCEDNEEQSKKIVDQEIRIMMSIDHPTIIKFIGYSLKDFKNESNPIILMQLATNGSLRKLIENAKNGMAPKNYSNTTIQIILVGIARGMKYLHDRAIAHRDLKPENILLDENYYPLITDFGLSNNFDIDHSQSLTGIVGTRLYMAPEVYNNKSGTKADVYSFAILMYEILTQKKPFKKSEIQNEMVFMNKVVHEGLRPRFKTHIKKSFENLIKQCWSANPNERPSFKEIFGQLANYRNDPDYYLDNVDINEFRNYVDMITEKKDPIEELLRIIDLVQKENEQLKYDKFQLEKKNDQLSIENNQLKNEIENLNNQVLSYSKKLKVISIQSSNNVKMDESLLIKDDMTIYQYNLLSMKNQQMLIPQIISKSAHDSAVLFFTKINNLMIFLMESNQLGEVKCLEIITNNVKNELLSSNYEDCSIKLRSEATESLYYSSQLNSNNLINNLRQFDQFYIEIQYPSESFKGAYELVISVKKHHFDSNDNKMKISILDSKSGETDKKFYGDSNINSVFFDSCVKSILPFSFEGCSNLKEVVIPSSVTKIGKSAFENCTSLDEVTIPSFVSIIEEAAFYECTSLKKITFNSPSFIKIIEMSAFTRCISLKEIEIPESVTSIESCLFSRCLSLEKISIPSKVTQIGSYAFYKCSSIKDLTIPDSVKEIGKDAFGGCLSLVQITLPSIVNPVFVGIEPEVNIRKI